MRAAPAAVSDDRCLHTLTGYSAEDVYSAVFKMCKGVA